MNGLKRTDFEDVSYGLEVQNIAFTPETTFVYLLLSVNIIVMQTGLLRSYLLVLKSDFWLFEKVTFGIATPLR